LPGVLESLAGESSLDVLLARITVPREGPLGNLAERVAELLAARAAHPDRLFGVLSRTSDRFSDEWAAVVGDARLVFLQGYGRGMQALGKLAAYSRFLRRDASCGTIEMPDPVPLVVGDARQVLGEVEAKDVLRAAGLPMIATTLAATADDAVEQARRFGYPVAVKVVSPEIVHKSDAGGVRLGLGDDDAVRAAFGGLQALSGFEGVAVQPMAQPGLELVLGAHRDPQFGPVVLFGLGGIFVETLHDVALRVAPISSLDAQDMLDDIRGHALLAGARGQPPVDRAALSDALQRLGDFMVGHPNVASVDLNPVLGYPTGILGVDARVALERRIREHD
jgi:acyl-CoA synthetase (NDP forming)